MSKKTKRDIEPARDDTATTATTMTDPDAPAPKRRWAMPHTYILLFGVILVATIATWLVPGGAFDRVEDPETGRTFVEPGSFHAVPAVPQGVFEAFSAVPQGMINVAQIIFFVFIVGGTFGILEGTGTVDRGLNSIIHKMNGREILAIPLLTLVFSLAGGIMGFAEELLPFYPIMVALAIKMGFDTVTGVSIVLLGAGAGFSGAFLNPFTIGIAQGIAELPPFSGLEFRLIVFVTFVSVTTAWVMWHAHRVRKDPHKSPTYELDESYRRQQAHVAVGDRLRGRNIVVLLIFLAGLAAIAVGVSLWGWYIPEITTIFLITGIAAGAAGRLTPNGMMDEFIKGAEKMVFGALVIGLAAGIIVVLQDGMIMDTIVNGLAGLITGFPSGVGALVMFGVQSVINLVIPSGSGQAAASMPIMVPIADLVGITRQTAVVAFQFGDGISNVWSPTSAYFMAGLALARVPWQKWLGYVWPLILLWTGLACVFVLVATAINLGPF